MEADRPVIGGHKGSVLDFDFNPFHEHIIASCSDDTTIKVWGIPEEGLTETITEPLVDLHGHGRKVTLLRFNPTTNNVLGSISADLTMRVWDMRSRRRSRQRRRRANHCCRTSCGTTLA